MKTKPDARDQGPVLARPSRSSTPPSRLLKQQRGIIGEYWSNYAVTQQAFEQGSTVLGTTWQVIANLATADGAKVQTVLPKEGSTAWSDTWMVSSKAKHPNCMYLWMDYITGPTSRPRWRPTSARRRPTPRPAT